MPGAGGGVLVARRADAWLAGWLAVVVWVGAAALRVGHVRLGLNVAPQVYWLGAAVSAAHFGLSYHLAYASGGPVPRRRRGPLVIAPAVLGAALAVVAVMASVGGRGSSRDVVGWAITTVYLFTTWHYVKQVYGLGRLAASFAGLRLSRTDARVLRFGLYPLAWLGASMVLVHERAFSFGGYYVGVHLLPADVRPALRVAAGVGAGALLVVFGRLHRQGRLPGLLVAPYVAAFLWLALPTSPVVSVLLLAPFHALQYLAVGHRAEVALARQRGERTSPGWWLNIASLATCGGLLLSRWAPNLLDRWTGSPGDPVLFAALFFVGLNLHHYLIDATIWRSSGDLVRAIARPVDATAPLPSRAPAAAGAP